MWLSGTTPHAASPFTTSGSAATGTDSATHATKQIKFVDEVEHDIAVDTVSPCITTGNGIDGSANVALLMEYVIKL